MEVLLISTVITFLIYGGLLLAVKFKRSSSEEIQRRRHIRSIGKEQQKQADRKDERNEEQDSESKESPWKKLLRKASKG